jgi:hypothetical protein
MGKNDLIVWKLGLDSGFACSQSSSYSWSYAAPLLITDGWQPWSSPNTCYSNPQSLTTQIAPTYF